MLNKKFYIVIFCIVLFICGISLLFIGPFVSARPPLKKEMGAYTAKPKCSKGELIILWGDRGRVLDLSSLVKDFEKNGIPGDKEGGKVTSIHFYRSDGKVFISNIKGREIAPCARIVDGKIIPIELEKGKKLPMCKSLNNMSKIIGITNEAVIRTKVNPNCEIIERGDMLVETCN